MKSKLLLIILDGVPYRNFRRLFGNLEGWFKSGRAELYRMRADLPSMSGPCYATIHTGVPPQTHGILLNEKRFRIDLPDIFSEVAKAGGKTGAVTHSYFSEFFNRYPFDPVMDLEYDEADGPIHHGRFHTMTGYNHDNQMTPSDVDLFGTLTMLIKRFGIDYGILHTCTLDSMGHRFGHDNVTMDNACATMDAMLAVFLPGWLEAGYEVIVTADHGQSDRGHHGGHEAVQQDVALYHFHNQHGQPGGGAAMSNKVAANIKREADGCMSGILEQTQLAPTILTQLGVTVPDTMQSKPFIGSGIGTIGVL